MNVAVGLRLANSGHCVSRRRCMLPPTFTATSSASLRTGNSSHWPSGSISAQRFLVSRLKWSPMFRATLRYDRPSKYISTAAAIAGWHGDEDYACDTYRSESGWPACTGKSTAILYVSDSLPAKCPSLTGYIPMQPTAPSVAVWSGKRGA